jgi:predicted nucleotidyltransferase
MALHPDVAIHLDEIRAAAGRYGVAKLEIFGSANTPRFDPERSDVDFLMHYPEGYQYGSFGKRLFDLEDEIAAILGRPAQLVMTRALRKESFLQNANRTRITIYESSTVDVDTSGRPDALPVHR